MQLTNSDQYSRHVYIDRRIYIYIGRQAYQHSCTLYHTDIYTCKYIDIVAHSITKTYVYSCKCLNIVAHSITHTYIVVSIST